MVGDGIDGIDGESVIAGMVEAPQEALGIEGQAIASRVAACTE
jgi:hypothetical protein